MLLLVKLFFKLDKFFMSKTSLNYGGVTEV